MGTPAHCKFAGDTVQGSRGTHGGAHEDVGVSAAPGRLGTWAAVSELSVNMVRERLC